MDDQKSLLFYKMAAAGDDLKSLLITYLTPSDQYTTFFSFWIAENNVRSHFRHFRSIHNFYCFDCFFHIMAGHFGFLKIAFYHIYRHSDQYAIFFSQNDCRWLLWMPQNHFHSHISPFQINMQLVLHLFQK